MLKIIGIISGLILPSYRLAIIHPSAELQIYCISTSQCKILLQDGCPLDVRQRGILLSDLLSAQEIQQRDSLGVVTATHHQNNLQGAKHVKHNLLKSETFAMLFPVR